MRYRSPEGRGMYVRRYLPANVRASKAQAEFLRGHLSPLPVSTPSPQPDCSSAGKLSERVLRARIILKQGRVIQLEAADTYKALHPDFRPSPTPTKWLGNFDFRRHGKQFRTSAAWDTAKIYTPEPYLGPSETISRLRDRSHETAGEFKASSPTDLWARSITPQGSLRKGEADSLLSRLTPRSDLSKASTCAHSIKIYKKSVEQYLRSKSP